MKIYVRERTKGQEGGSNPRFRVIATEGGELRFHAAHLRKSARPRARREEKEGGGLNRAVACL